MYSATLKAMKKRLLQAGFKGDLVPPPDGGPMFLFQAIQGKNNPVNVFYDNGCSHAVFRDGVPCCELQVELLRKALSILRVLAE